MRLARSQWPILLRWERAPRTSYWLGIQCNYPNRSRQPTPERVEILALSTFLPATTPSLGNAAFSCRFLAECIPTSVPLSLKSSTKEGSKATGVQNDKTYSTAPALIYPERAWCRCPISETVKLHPRKLRQSGVSSNSC